MDGDPVGVPRDGAEPPGPADLAAQLDDLERHRSLDVGARLYRARVLETEARATGAVVPLMRARLVQADMLHRVGDAAAAAELAVEVNAWAAERGPRSLLARSHLVLSSVFEGIGDAASALDHAVRALEMLGDDVPDRERGNYVLRLADALALTGSSEESLERYHVAEVLFGAAGDTERRLNVLNNVAMLHLENGDLESALGAVAALRAACGPDGLNPSSADTVARVLLATGDAEGAQDVVRLGERLLAEQGDAQATTPAELALTGAEVLLTRGLVEEAQAELERCLRICAERDLAGLRVQALAVRAQLLATREEFEQAYHAHRAFHDESVALRSQQQEAAARTRQALFETAEARRAAQRFWQQARTDVLTDLPNRRFVDEELPRYLREALDRGAVLVAAVVDVDHFKRINDTWSHDVGDEVLRRLAALLGASAETGGRDVVPALPGFAARLGGEEFLVVRVLVGASAGDTGPAGAPDVVAAVAALEDLRTAVSAADWSDLGTGLGVTVSVGASAARPDDTQKSLLTRADTYLYRAKQDGCDRVVSDLAAPVC